MIRIIFSLIIITIFSNSVLGQHADSTHIKNDRIKVYENVFWGNSWNGSLSCNFSKHKEFGVNIGRTNMQGGGFALTTQSWGLGYSYFHKNKNTGHLISAFGELSVVPIPNGTVRMDYLYDIHNNKQYIRPSIGLSLYIIDFLYNYSFKIYGDKNDFKHGFLIRIKLYTNPE